MDNFTTFSCGCGLAGISVLKLVLFSFLALYPYAEHKKKLTKPVDYKHSLNHTRFFLIYCLDGELTSTTTTTKYTTATTVKK